MLTPKETAELIVRALDGKKAQDIALLHTTEVTILADYFVICTAGSTTQLKSLSDEVEKVIKESSDQSPLRREGHRVSDWVLIDFGSVIVHIFLQESRDFYSLERLWADANQIDIKNLLTV